MLEFKYDTQLLLAGEQLSEDEIFDYITANFEGDSLLAVGDESLIKLHFHTNRPWEILAYCASLGDIFDIVVENMDRQTAGLQGKTARFLCAACKTEARTRAVFLQFIFVFILNITGRAPAAPVFQFLLPCAALSPRLPRSITEEKPCFTFSLSRTTPTRENS